jgi:hypothetical protein
MKTVSLRNSLHFLVVGALLTQTILGFAQVADKVKLEEGTQVRLRLMQTINSGTVHTGQTISFEVLDDVFINEQVVIKEGAPAWGVIEEAEGKKSFGRAGKLKIRLDYAKAVDGTKIPLRATATNEGKGRGMGTGIAFGASLLLFWPAAPFLGMMKGKNSEIPRGYHIEAFVDGDRMVRLVDPQGQSVPVPAPAMVASAGTPTLIQASMPLTPTVTSHTAVAVAAAGLGAVNVISDPGGAEVEIDGAFYGNTPGLIRLSPGLHTITVRIAGYEPWKRDLNIAPGSNLTVKATLEKSVRRK